MTEHVASSSLPVRASGEPQKAWNVDDVEAEIQKPGYSIIRGWLAIHGGASARIVLEEICQLIRASASPSDDGARQPQDEAWQIMHRIYRKVCEMTVGLPMSTTAFYDFGVPIIAEELATLRARIVVLETSVDSLSYLIDHPVTNPPEDETPQSQCPKCGHWQDDHDGFGVLKCQSCDFCAHPSIDGDTCNLCGRHPSVPSSPAGR